MLHIGTVYGSLRVGDQVRLFIDEVSTLCCSALDLVSNPLSLSLFFNLNISFIEV